MKFLIKDGKKDIVVKQLLDLQAIHNPPTPMSALHHQAIIDTSSDEAFKIFLQNAPIDHPIAIAAKRLNDNELSATRIKIHDSLKKSLQTTNESNILGIDLTTTSISTDPVPGFLIDLGIIGEDLLNCQRDLSVLLIQMSLVGEIEITEATITGY